jgi:HEAT repeat protein
MRRLLAQLNFSAALKELSALPPGQALKPLQASLAAGEARIRWRAITALGLVVPNLAVDDPEAAREFLRRLLWCLNEESGAAPWGVAEALGEILANLPDLAPEYANLLLSYVWPGGNFLDWGPLLAGAVWGVGRLAQAQPELMRQRGAMERLLPLLEHQEAAVRGMAAWALGNLGQAGAVPALERLIHDPAGVELWQGNALGQATVGKLVREAINKIYKTNY